MLKNTLFLASILATPLQAAIIHYDVVHSTVNPRYSSTEENSFSITYDESKITGSGDETLSSADASFALRFDGKDYSATDDSLYPSFPLFTFSNGSPTGINFYTSLKSDGAESDSYLQVLNFSITYGFNINEESVTHLVNVPEPSSSALILIGASFLTLRKRR